MKKTLLLFALAAFTAHSASALFKVGPEVGLNLSKLSYSAAAAAGSTSSSITGLRAGLTTDIGLGPISVQPGIFYSMKGGKQSYNYLGLFSADLKNTVNYIEVPVWIQYKVKLGPGKVFVGVAPSVAVGISGKAKLSATALGQTVDSAYNVTFGSDSADIKRLDYAANFNVGYELGMGLFVRVFYSLGLANLSNITAYDSKNRSFGITVGYLFGK